MAGAVDTLALTDRRGRDVLVPAAKIAYVEIGLGDGDRQIGFGADRRCDADRPDRPPRSSSSPARAASARPRSPPRSPCWPRHGPRVLVCEVDAKGTLAAAFEAGPLRFEARDRCTPASSAMAMDTEDSLREYLRLYLRLPLVARLGPLARTLRLRGRRRARA